MLRDLQVWVVAHLAIIWPILSGLFVMILRTRTSAEWIELGESNARLQGLIKFLRGAGLDPVKSLEGLKQFLSGKAKLDPEQGQIFILRLANESKDREIADLRPQIAALQGDRLPIR